jgi:hypothetical protein
MNSEPGRTAARFAATLQSFLNNNEDTTMGRGILLWLLGVPLPVILLLAMCSHR